MTFEEACQIYYINEEIKILKKELCELEEERKNRTYSKAITYSDMPKGCGMSDPMVDVDELVDQEKAVQQMLAYNIQRLQRARKDMEIFLQTIEKAEERLILRLRCINNMTWQEIGDEIGMSRMTVKRKWDKFWQENKDQ